jgi:hypothetical protein
VLRQTAHRSAAEPVRDPRLGYGIINAERALECLSRLP